MGSERMLGDDGGDNARIYAGRSQVGVRALELQRYPAFNGRMNEVVRPYV